MSKVLVTGASGFIGRQTLPVLVRQGVEVVAVSTGKNEIRIKGVTWLQADLLDENSRHELLHTVRPTHVLHFAWVATPGVYWTSPLNDAWKEATLDLMKLAKECGTKRFVGAGSCAEYDWSSGHCDEFSTPINPTTPYGKAKGETSALVTAEKGIGTAWGRIFLLYGPYEHPKRLVSSAILSLLNNQRAKCSHGKQVRDFLHVHDVADAFVTLLFSDVRGAVNIGSGVPVTIREVVETIGKELKKETHIDFGAIEAGPNDPPVLTAKTQRLNTEVGWQPSLSLEDGLKETIEWWKNNM